MIVPSYWAEGRLHDRVSGKQVTIRRFGWSEVSQSEAQVMADQRAQETLTRFRQGDRVVRREPKLAYNGAEGVPIREEVISRHGDIVITRNLYGARCLNTPNVLFADIDFAHEAPTKSLLLTIVLLLFGAIASGLAFHSKLIGFGGSAVALVFGHVIASAVHRLRQQSSGGVEKQARSKISQFSASHPEWHLRLYRTPAGLRVLVMHRTFKPDDPVVAECFQALGTDPLYVRMCLNQKCFRARVSPKPWRIGINDHIKPRPGVWPVNPERLPERCRWIEAYEQKARSHAACHFIETLGHSSIHPAARSVQLLHDEFSQAASGLPLG